MLVPVQKQRRLPAADARGGPLGALLHGGAKSACKSLAFPGAASIAQNQGEAVRIRGGGSSRGRCGGSQGGRVGRG